MPERTPSRNPRMRLPYFRRIAVRGLSAGKPAAQGWTPVYWGKAGPGVIHAPDPPVGFRTWWGPPAPMGAVA